MPCFAGADIREVPANHGLESGDRVVRRGREQRLVTLVVDLADVFQQCPYQIFAARVVILQVAEAHAGAFRHAAHRKRSMVPGQQQFMGGPENARGRATATRAPRGTRPYAIVVDRLDLVQHAHAESRLF